jgi:hypothetical protein
MGVKKNKNRAVTLNEAAPVKEASTFECIECEGKKRGINL